MDGVECTECPASFITTESIELLEWYARARRAHSAFGVLPFGSDLRKWPAVAVDLVQILDAERSRVELAEMECVRTNHGDKRN